jgi:thiol-disulfide isomerase/thioredoxin
MRCGLWSRAVNKWLQTGALLIVAAAAGFAGYHFNRANLDSPAAKMAARELLLLPLVDLNGKTQTLSRQQAKILVVNFWATWCPPCREEIPVLKKIQKKYASNSVEIVGIALDNAVKVQEYSTEMGIDYGLLIGGVEVMAASRDLGNRGEVLPFTVILDRTRQVAFTHAGALSDAALDAALVPLL